MKTRVMSFLLFLGAFGFYLHYAAPSVTTGDSGEFITAVGTLSLPHAPSFPAYALLGRSVSDLLPFGSIAYRCNVFSALASAAGLVMLFSLLTYVTAEIGVALLVTILSGLTVSMWENSIVTEVFALNTAFAMALMLCVVRRRYALGAFVFGLAFGNHQVILFVAAACVGYVAIEYLRRRPGGKLFYGAVAGMAALFSLGLSIYLYLPIRAAKEPPLNWGQPKTIEKLTRSVLRKDYGTLNLATGETPPRTLGNAVRHVRKFGEHLFSEVPLPAILLGIWGFLMAAIQRRREALLFGLILFMTGPFFFWLGNLPFTAQSDGIVGRFMILPSLALLMAIPFALTRRRVIAIAVLCVCIVIAFQHNAAQAEARRSSTLVLDYGRAMLRTLPPNATLFLDGGDDAFYSLAMLHFVDGRRPDVELHDRGGLVFRNPYGGDFRSTGAEEKQKRRWAVEQTFLARGPLYYATMDQNVLPGYGLVQAGFLVKVAAGPTRPIQWPLLVLRSLYPLAPSDYRARALGPFFPFMRGRQYASERRIDDAIRYFRRAEAMGRDVEWLRTNLESDYIHLAFDLFLANDFVSAEKVYRACIAFDPQSFQAQSNLGVMLEKQGRMAEARAQYEWTARAFPREADPVFNLAVMAWKDRDWARVVSQLEEVLRRRPDHPQARGYLHAAFKNMVRK